MTVSHAVMTNGFKGHVDSLALLYRVLSGFPGYFDVMMVAGGARDWRSG